MLHKLPGTLQENHWLGSAILPSCRPPPTPFSLPFSPQISSSCRVSHLTSIIGTPRQCATREGNGLLSQNPLKKKNNYNEKKKNKINKAVSPTPPSSLAAERELLAGPRRGAAAAAERWRRRGLRGVRGSPAAAAHPGGPAAPLLAPLLSPLLSRRLRLPPPRTHRLAGRGRRMSAAPEAAWGREAAGCGLNHCAPHPRVPLSLSPPGVGR